MGYKLSFVFAILGSILLFIGLAAAIFLFSILILFAEGELTQPFWFITVILGTLYLLIFYAAIRVWMKKKWWSICFLLWALISGAGAGICFSIQPLDIESYFLLSLPSLLFLAAFISAMTGKRKETYKLET
ncbi:hypothetical protein GKZ89_14935 [Bacillus mangrovi]|uniref:Uncharacterized protein n=1 Tax=Metabacillus mangrovi TaxID=1491830 RepID=A0A7X2S8F3_9BACI|nr:hypothetical protein [Metabacillus mangrovi]MTH54696.1 hypothetical protein [Metabacillus mangrovi]